MPSLPPFVTTPHERARRSYYACRGPQGPETFQIAAGAQGTIALAGRWNLRGEEDEELRRPRRPHRPDIRSERPVDVDQIDDEDQYETESELDEELGG